MVKQLLEFELPLELYKSVQFFLFEDIVELDILEAFQMDKEQVRALFELDESLGRLQFVTVLALPSVLAI